MRITYSHQGKEEVFNSEEIQIIVGRPKKGVAIDLDIIPDEKVSRPHPRVWAEFGVHWIEDLNSTHGTQVNGEEIRGKGKCRLRTGDAVFLGETTLWIDIHTEQENSAETLPPEELESELFKGITQSLNADDPAFVPAKAPFWGLWEESKTPSFAVTVPSSLILILISQGLTARQYYIT